MSGLPRIADTGQGGLPWRLSGPKSAAADGGGNLFGNDPVNQFVEFSRASGRKAAVMTTLIVLLVSIALLAVQIRWFAR
jgi:hypothetical protein